VATEPHRESLNLKPYLTTFYNMSVSNA